jgi:hypothetical protein
LYLLIIHNNIPVTFRQKYAKKLKQRRQIISESVLGRLVVRIGGLNRFMTWPIEGLTNNCEPSGYATWILVCSEISLKIMLAQWLSVPVLLCLFELPRFTRFLLPSLINQVY